MGPAPYAPLRRAAWLNGLGRRALVAAERDLSPAGLRRLREALWPLRLYLYVMPGTALTQQALAIFPPSVRELGARASFHRYDARGGGGYWPDRNEIWLAAGVETYEGLAQVPLSSRHELFHFIARNHPLYRPDDEAGFARLRGALRASRADIDRFPRYRDWIRAHFLPQGDHANPAELFADIPTNFPDPLEIPPPLREYFAPLLTGEPGGPASAEPAPADDLAAFHDLIRG